MNSEIICVGTELLLGNTLNTNAHYLSGKLAELGISVFNQTVVGDNPVRLKDAFMHAFSRSDIIILTGGLGPTEDDLTKETICEALNINLINDANTENKIKQYFYLKNKEMPQNNLKQALVPKNAIILENNNGTAPGFIIKTQNKNVIILPGPPSELIPMFEEGVFNYLKGLSGSALYSENIKVLGVGESKAAEVLGELLNSANPTVATYAKESEVLIRITASDKNEAAAKEKTTPVVNKVLSLFGENVFSTKNEEIEQAVVRLLKQKNYKITTAESCTAGMVSGLITNVPGSSSVFEMGITAYSNFIKINALNIKKETIEKYSAISAQTAIAMAENARKLTKSNLALAVTGNAGPDISENKPVGLVYTALSDGTNGFVMELNLAGNREKIRTIAAKTALDMARRYLENKSEFLSFGFNLLEEPAVYKGYSLPATPKEPLAVIKPKEPQELKEPQSTQEPQKPKEDKPNEHTYEPNFKQLEEEFTLPTKKEQKALQNSTNKKGFGEVLRKIIFYIALITLIVTLGILGFYFYNGYKQKNIIKNAAAEFNNYNGELKNNDGIFVGFEGLLAKNKDVVGWIKIDGTEINHPVYKTDDNDYYINHNMNREQSEYGAIFIDKAAKINETGESKNLVLYGHNMNDGAMFGTLKRYRTLDFYKEHPTFSFKTLYNNYTYQVFSVFITNADKAQDNGNLFSYRYNAFASNESFISYINELQKRSIINTGVILDPTDDIITLSTCANDFKNARLVVVAKKITNNNITPANLAAYNPIPVYPAAYYEKHGGSKPSSDSVNSALNAINSKNSQNQSSNSQDDSSANSALNNNSPN